jgi:hypothetical protein
VTNSTERMIAIWATAQQANATQKSRSAAASGIRGM